MEKINGCLVEKRLMNSCTCFFLSLEYLGDFLCELRSVHHLLDSRNGWLVISWFLVLIFNSYITRVALFKSFQEIKAVITLWAGVLFFEVAMYSTFPTCLVRFIQFQ